MIKPSRTLLLTFAFILVAAACSSAGGTDQPLILRGAWARPGIPGGNSAIYFVVENPNSQNDALLSASSDVAETVELHMTSMSDDDMMSMQHQMSVELPGNDETSFEPGGLHVMLINLQRELKDGETITVVLNFKGAGKVQLDVPVRQE
jgi:periplasmic copper chaperone A